MGLQWVRLPLAAVLDERLQRSDMVLYAVLLDRCDRSNTFAISVGQLQQLTGLSERTVRRSMQRLHGVDLISIRRTGRASEITVKEVLPAKQRAAFRRSTAAAAADLEPYAAMLNRSIRKESAS